MNELDKILGRTIICDDPFRPWVETEEEKLRRKILYLETKVQELERKEVKLPKRYIINKDATILMWQDGTKTIVRRCADDEFNPRLAFLTAFFQHHCGMSKNKANKYLANLQVEEAKEVKEKKKTPRKPKHMKEETGFKVGDKVKVIKGDFFSEKNWTGTIIEEKSGLFLIEYNNGLSWYVAPKQIKLIKEGK